MIKAFKTRLITVNTVRLPETGRGLKSHTFLHFQISRPQESPHESECPGRGKMPRLTDTRHRVIYLHENQTISSTVSQGRLLGDTSTSIVLETIALFSCQCNHSANKFNIRSSCKDLSTKVGTYLVLLNCHIQISAKFSRICGVSSTGSDCVSSGSDSVSSWMYNSPI